jgi:hypothetical protein
MQLSDLVPQVAPDASSRPARPSTLQEFFDRIPSCTGKCTAWRASPVRLVILDELWENVLTDLVLTEFQSFRLKQGSYHGLLLPTVLVEMLAWYEQFGYADGRYPRTGTAEVQDLGPVPDWVVDQERYAALIAAAHDAFEPRLPTLSTEAAVEHGLDALQVLALALDVVRSCESATEAVQAAVGALTSHVLQPS